MESSSKATLRAKGLSVKVFMPFPFYESPVLRNNLYQFAKFMGTDTIAFRNHNFELNPELCQGATLTDMDM
jgi:hypothetical protein